MTIDKDMTTLSRHFIMILLTILLVLTIPIFAVWGFVSPLGVMGATWMVYWIFGIALNDERNHAYSTNHLAARRLAFVTFIVGTVMCSLSALSL